MFETSLAGGGFCRIIEVAKLAHQLGAVVPVANLAGSGFDARSNRINIASGRSFEDGWRGRNIWKQNAWRLRAGIAGEEIKLGGLFGHELAGEIDAREPIVVV